MKANINTCHCSIAICSFSYVRSILTINKKNAGGEEGVEGEASSSVIPTIHWTSFRDLNIAEVEVEVN
jgi:hypothetical protein